MRLLVEELKQLLADIVGVDLDKIFVEKTYFEQGIAASNLRDFSDALQRKYGLAVPNLLRECNSIANLHAHIARDLNLRVGVEHPDLFVNLGFREGLPELLFYE